MNRSIRDKELFEKIASDYAAKDLHPPSAIARENQLIEMICRCLEDIPMGDVLEIGCGAGFAARYLQGRYKSYTGLDHSTKMVELANMLHRDLENSHFFSIDIQRVSLDSVLTRPVDTILCSGVLHHLEEPLLAINNVIKMIKPGGHFIALEPNNGNPIIQGLRSLRKKFDSSYSSEQTFYSAEGLRSLLQQAGLTQITVRHEGYLSPPFAQVKMHPSFLFLPLSRFALWGDRSLVASIPAFLQSQSWNLVCHGRSPHP